MVTSSRPLLFLINLSIKRDWIRKRNKVDFLKAFSRSFFKISFFPGNFLHAMAVLVYLPKLKRSLGLGLDAYFLHDFSIKMFLIEYSIYGQSFNVIPSFLLRISNKVLLSSYLDNWWRHNFKIYLQSSSNAKPTARKNGRPKHKNLNISRMKWAFSME